MDNLKSRSVAKPTHGLFKDLEGQRFGRLTVVAYAGKRGSRDSKWLCRCDCGAEKIVAISHLTSGDTRSCGCLNAELSAARRTTHGESPNGTTTPEYTCWCHIKDRCSNPNGRFYHRYGGRGIRVCARWENSYENFLADMGRRPAPELSIDRIDNDGDYRPGNCRWATKTEQNRNSTATKLTRNDVEEIRELRLNGIMAKDIAERFEISAGYVSVICTGKAQR